VAQVFSGSWSIYRTHAYARPGTYGVRVTVTARAGRIRTIRAGVEVRAPGEPLRLG
jgi:acyl-coenzyme A thioesterase PaaI-like protein